MRVNVSQLAEWTGRDRHTIRKQLADLPAINGKKGAMLFDSRKALAVIFEAGNLEDARAKHALSQVSLNEVREEELRRSRIPLEEVSSVIDLAFQSVASTLKAAKNRRLTPELINEIFDKFRAGLAKLK